MPSDIPQHLLAEARQRAVAEQVRLEQEQAQAGERYHLASVEDRIELAEAMARDAWRHGQSTTRALYPDQRHDPFRQAELPAQTRTEVPERPADRLADRDRSTDRGQGPDR